MDETIFKDLKSSLEEARKYKAGELEAISQVFRVNVPDVKAIREKLDMSQERFAKTFGWSKDTVSSWEQGRRVPDHSARLLFALIMQDPTFMLDSVKKLKIQA